MSCTRLLIINILILLTFQLLLVKGQIDVTVTPTSITVNEDDGGSFVVSLHSDDLMMLNDDIITINITTDNSGALNGTDYIVPSYLSINTNDPNTTVFNLTVYIINDDIAEYNESALIMFESQNVTFTPSSVPFTILDTDIVTVSINNTNASLFEGEQINLCASTNGSHSLSFNVTANASTTDDISPSTSTLSFGPDDIMKCTSFIVINDSVPEGAESVTIGWSLSSASLNNVFLLEPLSTIIDIESQLQVSLLNDSVLMVSEGGTVKICLMLNRMGGITGVTVNYIITGDSNDYSGPMSSGIIGFTTSDVSCITLTIDNDNIIENNESISIQFGPATGATLVPNDNNNTIIINIMDNTAVLVSINSSVTVDDSSSVVKLCSTLNDTGVSFDGVSLTLNATTSTAGNATLGVDYSSVPMDIIPMVPGCGNVSLTNNSDVRGNRLLIINWTLLISPQISDTRISLDTTSTNITIIDTDFATIGFANSTTIVVSESVGSVSVSLSNISGTISAPFTVSITAETRNRTGFFNFTDRYIDWSMSYEPVVVTINNNNIINEGNRTLTLSLSITDSNGLNISIGNGTVKITVTEDDFPTTSSSTMTTPTISMTPTTSAMSTTSSMPTISPIPTISTTPTESSTPAGFFNTITIVGLIVGVVILGLLLLLLLVCVIACIKVRSNRQGFYATQEDKEDVPQMLRYSASLRSLQSQTVMPVDTRDKENEYLV